MDKTNELAIPGVNESVVIDSRLEIDDVVNIAIVDKEEKLRHGISEAQDRLKEIGKERDKMIAKIDKAAKEVVAKVKFPKKVLDAAQVLVDEGFISIRYGAQLKGEVSYHDCATHEKTGEYIVRMTLTLEDGDGGRNVFSYMNEMMIERPFTAQMKADQKKLDDLLEEKRKVGEHMFELQAEKNDLPMMERRARATMALRKLETTEEGRKMLVDLSMAADQTMGEVLGAAVKEVEAKSAKAKSSKPKKKKKKK